MSLRIRLATVDTHDTRALREARRQYDRAVERHFVAAHRLVAQGQPDEAERVAKAACALRLDAHFELCR